MAPRRDQEARNGKGKMNKVFELSSHMNTFFFKHCQDGRVKLLSYQLPLLLPNRHFLIGCNILILLDLQFHISVSVALLLLGFK